MISHGNNRNMFRFHVTALICRFVSHLSVLFPMRKENFPSPHINIQRHTDWSLSMKNFWFIRSVNRFRRRSSLLTANRETSSISLTCLTLKKNSEKLQMNGHEPFSFQYSRREAPSLLSPSPVYLCPSSPRQTTTDHFWQMVWEQNSRVIVMLMHLIEKESRSHRWICRVPEWSGRLQSRCCLSSPDDENDCELTFVSEKHHIEQKFELTHLLINAVLVDFICKMFKPRRILLRECNGFVSLIHRESFWKISFTEVLMHIRTQRNDRLQTPEQLKEMIFSDSDHDDDDDDDGKLTRTWEDIKIELEQRANLAADLPPNCQNTDPADQHVRSAVHGHAVSNCYQKHWSHPLIVHRGIFSRSENE